MFLSFHSEATGLLDRCQQLIVQLVVALIGRNVDPIEAGRKQKERSWSYGRLKSTRHTHDNKTLCACVCVDSAHQVWALGRLLVLASIWWMVKSLGPAAPAGQTQSVHQVQFNISPTPQLSIKFQGLWRNPSVITESWLGFSWMHANTHPVKPWSLAAGLWMSQWQTAVVGPSFPHQTIPRLSKTTWRCCCQGCSVSGGCWTSSLRCRSCPGHTQSAERKKL